MNSAAFAITSVRRNLVLRISHLIGDLIKNNAAASIDAIAATFHAHENYHDQHYYADLLRSNEPGIPSDVLGDMGIVIRQGDVVGVVGGEGVAEGQREKHAEWRTALRLSVEQAGEEHRFRCRLSPPDCLAGTDQPGKIERFGRYGDRGFHAPLRADISSAIGLPRTARPRGAERPNPGSRRALAEER